MSNLDTPSHKNHHRNKYADYAKLWIDRVNDKSPFSSRAERVKTLVMLTRRALELHVRDGLFRALLRSRGRLAVVMRLHAGGTAHGELRINRYTKDGIEKSEAELAVETINRFNQLAAEAIWYLKVGSELEVVRHMSNVRNQSPSLDDIKDLPKISGDAKALFRAVFSVEMNGKLVDGVQLAHDELVAMVKAPAEDPVLTDAVDKAVAEVVGQTVDVNDLIKELAILRDMHEEAVKKGDEMMVEAVREMIAEKTDLAHATNPSAADALTEAVTEVTAANSGLTEVANELLEAVDVTTAVAEPEVISVDRKDV